MTNSKHALYTYFTSYTDNLEVYPSHPTHKRSQSARDGQEPECPRPQYSCRGSARRQNRSRQTKTKPTKPEPVSIECHRMGDEEDIRPLTSCPARAQRGPPASAGWRKTATDRCQKACKAGGCGVAGCCFALTLGSYLNGTINSTPSLRPKITSPLPSGVWQSAGKYDLRTSGGGVKGRPAERSGGGCQKRVWPAVSAPWVPDTGTGRLPRKRGTNFSTGFPRALRRKGVRAAPSGGA